MSMFDPIYVTEVINDILSRRALQLVLTPKTALEGGEIGKIPSTVSVLPTGQLKDAEEHQKERNLQNGANSKTALPAGALQNKMPI